MMPDGAVSIVATRPSQIRPSQIGKVLEAKDTTSLKKEIEADHQILHIWPLVKKLDVVARPKHQEPTLNTCCCGGCVLVVVLMLYIGLALNRFIHHEPTIAITEARATAKEAAPMPDIGISLGEDYPTQAINESVFLKHAKVDFIFKSILESSTFGRVKTTTHLKRWSGNSDCGFQGMKYQDTELFMCALRDDRQYDTTVSMNAMDDDANSRMGSDRLEQNASVRHDNLKIRGSYNDLPYNYLRVEIRLNTSNLSEMEDEFFKDPQGKLRKLKVNLWMKLDEEDWSSPEGLRRAPWQWYVFDRLPRYNPDDDPQRLLGVDHEVELSPQTASVGPICSLGLVEAQETSKAWFSFEKSRDKTVQDIVRDTTGNWSPGDMLFEVTVRVGRKARHLHVTYPTFADTVSAIGGSYNIALACAIVWTAFVAKSIVLHHMLAGDQVHQASDPEGIVKGKAVQQDPDEVVPIALLKHAVPGQVTDVQS